MLGGRMTLPPPSDPRSDRAEGLLAAPSSRAEWALVLASIGLAVGALWMGEGRALAWFAALPSLAFGAALLAWHRQPDASTAALVLVVAGFLRLILGPVGLGALWLVPAVADRADREQSTHLVVAAAGMHLAVLAAHGLAGALGEPFPALATMSAGEAVAGLALFLPFVVVGQSSPPR